MNTILVGLICVAGSVFLMTGCSASSTAISASSEKDLAALYDATKGERVVLYYSDTLTSTIKSASADDLLVTAHTASWTNGTEGLVSIKTSQILRITCVSCTDYTATGVILGGVVGTGTGLVIGSIIDLTSMVVNVGRTLIDAEYRPPGSTIPASVIVGGVLGMLIGGGVGSNAAQDDIWIFKPREIESPLSELVSE